jgi:hypothetical protein
MVAAPASMPEGGAGLSSPRVHCYNSGLQLRRGVSVKIQDLNPNWTIPTACVIQLRHPSQTLLWP